MPQCCNEERDRARLLVLLEQLEHTSGCAFEQSSFVVPSETAPYRTHRQVLLCCTSDKLLASLLAMLQ